MLLRPCSPRTVGIPWYRLRSSRWPSHDLSDAQWRPTIRGDAKTPLPQKSAPHRTFATTTTGTDPQNYVPLRKQLKEEAKAKRGAKRRNGEDPRLARWELTVGIEIHAQLNTESKLFSRAPTTLSDVPNSNISLFDLAFPGSQPEFQTATLLPALRAAIALNCDIQRVSRFDRKHYFYQDQPAGYQITQYYGVSRRYIGCALPNSNVLAEPFAKDGSIILADHDGISPEDGESIQIGIKQIQMEQDTAKSQEIPPSTHVLDFNRVSQPLIEIITLPQIHSPATAAACVRKIQAILQSVGAVTTGMEMGGLRADVNVSVRRRDQNPGAHQYHGVAGLGQRTEIKNLSSFKAVEDAIIAERNRQITVLEQGGVVEGETRGWSIGSTETRKLRGKEGEVDYRYMPEPDLAPVVIGEDVLGQLRQDLPPLPDALLQTLIGPNYGLTVKDAKPLIELDDGARLEYFQEVVDILAALQKDRIAENRQSLTQIGITAGNWVLHELGGLLAKSDLSWDPERVPANAVAGIVDHLLQGNITGSTAKSLLVMVFDGDTRSVERIVDEENLLLRPLSRDEYIALAEGVIQENPKMAAEIRDKKQLGKVGFFVGRMMSSGEKGRTEAKKANEILRELLGV
ncbi:hypothetical protein FQN54_004882 [Arachnomyces sp. PD_36]|nr:hypothetical protein FQN54_004882 [Arachnomyces sp. PD_36]